MHTHVEIVAPRRDVMGDMGVGVSQVVIQSKGLAIKACWFGL
jgi:hypothetical protein